MKRGKWVFKKKLSEIINYLTTKTPHLNPIEKMWAILKNEIWKIKHEINNQDELKKSIEYIFYTHDSI